MVLAVSLTAGGLAGCTGDGYRYGDHGFSQYNVLDDTDKMIRECQLTPADVLMVDLNGSWFTNLAQGCTCNGIRSLLVKSREERGPIPDALMFNPALESDPGSLVGLQYAALWVDRVGLSPDEQQRSVYGVLVNLIDQTVAVELGHIFVFYDNPLNPAAVSPLNASARDSLLRVLSGVSSWGGDRQEGDLSQLGVSDWSVAIVTADSQLYRWQARWTLGGLDLVPSGFVDVYKAFMAVAGQ